MGPSTENRRQTRRARAARVSRAVAFGLAGFAALAALASCVDESHELEVQALGGEAPGVPRGPLHRPGQPCLVCHGGLGPASAQFVMGGTVYAFQGENGAAVGAQVQIEDIGGSFYTATTNEVGNFYITTDEWAPDLPAQVQVAQGAVSQQMTTHISRDGSCASCHTRPASPTSPGPVYVAVPSLGGP